MTHIWREEIIRSVKTNRNDKNVVKHFAQCSPNNLKAPTQGLCLLP